MILSYHRQQFATLINTVIGSVIIDFVKQRICCILEYEDEILVKSFWLFINEILNMFKLLTILFIITLYA